MFVTGDSGVGKTCLTFRYFENLKINVFNNRLLTRLTQMSDTYLLVHGFSVDIAQESFQLKQR